MGPGHADGRPRRHGRAGAAGVREHRRWSSAAGARPTHLVRSHLVHHRSRRVPRERKAIGTAYREVITATSPDAGDRRRRASGAGRRRRDEATAVIPSESQSNSNRRVSAASLIMRIALRPFRRRRIRASAPPHRVAPHPRPHLTLPDRGGIHGEAVPSPNGHLRVRDVRDPQISPTASGSGVHRHHRRLGA